MLAMPMLPLPLSRPRSLDFTVREISGGFDKRRFVRFAANLYRGDRYWAPGIISERSNALDPKKNPALARLQIGLFVAESRTLDEVVGSVAVWVDSRGDATRSAPRTGCFGLIEAVNEGDVISSLLETAETWVREHLPGAGGLRGPMDPDPCRSPGLLVDGYNHKPAILMPYNPPYYAELIEQAGYEPGAELLAYHLDLSTLREPPSPEAFRLQTEAQIIEARRDLVVREIGGESDWRTILPQAEHGLADTTWRLGPESQAMTFPEILSHLKRIAGRQPPATILAARAQEDGDVVAFGVAAPNVRQSALAAFGKRLTNRWPAGKQSAPLPGMASRRARRAGTHLLPPIVRADCRNWGLERLLLSGLLTRTAQRGYTAAEISPVQASDAAVGQALAEYGATPYKTYQIYEKRF
jgi:hypothetical protein